MNSQSLLNLLHLSDSALPIGGYAHSAGLETYIQQDVVKDITTAKEFITGMLDGNIHYTDAAFVSFAYDATTANNMDEIILLDNECTAVKLPLEIREASHKLGVRLLKIFSRICNNGFAEKYSRSVQQKEARGNYCIAFGIYASCLNIGKTEMLTGFYYNAAAAMVTNCVKLIPLGQMDGQELLFSLHGLIEGLVQKSLKPDRELLGFCCSGFDIRCMQHETLYSRLYMS